MKYVTGILLMSVTLLMACSSSATPTGYPLDTRTGNAEIDPVLAAVASGDPDDQRALIEYTDAPCTWKEGLGGPPKCRDDEPEGTILEVLPFIDSEGGFFRKAEIDNWQGVQPTALYAIYQVPQNALHEEYYPQGDYLAFYTSGENQPVDALHIANGKIVRVDTLFVEFPDALKSIIEREALKVMLAPKTR
jgi:hypothetical protein